MMSKDTKDTLVNISKRYIDNYTDIIQKYESGEDIPEVLYTIAKGSLPKWKENLDTIEKEWPQD